MSQLSASYPTIKPSLNLDFARTKTLDPRVTFARASTATFYDGVTVALAEQNLLIRSQEFNDSIWAKGNATAIANTVVAPDGTTTADTITCTATSGAHDTFQNATLVSGTPYVMSVFVKKNTNDFIQLRHYTAAGGATRYANFNIATGVLGTVGADATASITDAGNGWYRCTMIATPTGSSGGLDFFIIDSATAISGAPFTAVGTESVYVWGAQLEQRSAVTAYTATTTQPITNYIPVLRTAAAGVARFDHNPTTGESLGLLIEEQRANLLTYSEDFTNAAWTKTNITVTPNQITAPDGTLTGDKIIESTSTTLHQIERLPSGSGVNRAYTVFAKAAERRYVTLLTAYTLGAQSNATFDLVTGTVTQKKSGSNATITPAGNGWYRLYIDQASYGGTNTINIALSTTGTPNSDSYGRDIYTGDGVSGIYIWGAQLEAGAFATSYIPTVASSVTRSADAASMTGNNFSSWYRADEGTLYIEFNSGKNSGNNYGAFVVSDNSASNRFLLASNYPSGFNNVMSVITNGSTVVETSSFMTLAQNAFGKAALAVKTNDFAASGNGGAVVTDTSGSMPVVNRIDFGFFYPGVSGTNTINGTIKKIAYYPARLTNAQLQALTT